jgi:hypothetical protein
MTAEERTIVRQRNRDAYSNRLESETAHDVTVPQSDRKEKPRRDPDDQ